MTEENYNWHGAKFRKDPYRVPDGYFDNLTDRIISRINQESAVLVVKRERIMKPWMAWVSGIAAILVIGWFGLSEFYMKPHQEKLFQEELGLFVDYYADELHEGKLAGYLEEYGVEVTLTSGIDYQDLIISDPENAEEYIYESIEF